MKRILIFLLFAVAFAALALPASAADPITVNSTKFVNNFRTNLIFQLDTQSSAGKINQIALLIQLDGVASSARQIPEFTPGAQVQTKYEWDLIRTYLPPGATGKYWWDIQDDQGNKLTTDKQSFRVDDIQHQWQKLNNSKLALYWYRGGDSFGKALFDRANQAIEMLEKDTGVVVDQTVQIFIYGSNDDLKKSISAGAQEWTGGQAFPEYGIVVVGVEPSNLEWGKDATTHELTHQIIHQKIRSPLGDLSMPRWMDEGLAVYYETIPGTLDSQFSTPLKRAIQNDTLVPMRTLSGNFPADSSAANLAYAQSYSMVDFIYRKYGKEKMAELLQEFKVGGAYDDILRKILGVDTDSLDNQWRADIGAKPRVIPTRNASQPTAFPTFGLSTDYSTPVAGAKPTATPQQVAQNSSASSAVPQSSQAPSDPGVSIQLCSGSMAVVLLGLLGMVWSMKRRTL
ncbi:MAG: hypothetical protein HZB51_09235 [Chloroflexi bacterium]|nr:hypothetical protein [Chloroflexota bacterium]